MSLLFSKLTIREVTFRNRITVSPMCMYSSEDGFANNWHMVHLGSRAVGGAGLVIFEATAVSPEGRISIGDLGLWKDEHIPVLQEIVTFIHEQGAIAGIQLAHAGRKASFDIPFKGTRLLAPGEGGWQTVAPSAIPFSEATSTPQALNADGIKKVIKDFVKATIRALQAGFKVIEIHAAHGYLLHEFLSPLSNKRSDHYGGSFENRTRLLREIVQAVRTEWPSYYPLFVRISATDWVENGWSISDSVALAKELMPLGVDLIDASSGANIPNVKIPAKPLYQVPLSASIKELSGILTGAVGLITTPQEAEDIIAKGQADMVMMARQLLRDPYFPMHAAHALGASITWPVQYERAAP
ncbi:NADH:flavin oxidoreductase/NADH oxidase [Chitinophaga skermanii]|nr:NADH:flavin oxidoreductase/NADH oxidase [Chitinophaga skermanii]